MRNLRDKTQVFDFQELTTISLNFSNIMRASNGNGCSETRKSNVERLRGNFKFCRARFSMINSFERSPFSQTIK